ncbi:hypothetical protein EV424DRAFT_1537112 [Suillus variegatus]|nr:hypothetical protein EV424DRAFT_1537112 [Suillus variegatus]
MRLPALLICVFLYFVGVIQAAPTTNTTDTTTSDSFKAPSFTTRTIWTIVSSSVLTLFACIYSAIHPNIPSPQDSPNDILLRRLGMMIMALIAPELIVTWAMRQWFSARLVTRQFKESGYPNVRPDWKPEEKESVNSEAREQRENCFLLFLAVLVKGTLSVLVFPWRFPGVFVRSVKRSVNAYFLKKSEDYTWTQTHSFFVLMGGFMLYVDGKPYLTLRPDDILKLMRKGCIDFPTLTANQIYDRSKGNAISKGLVMLQVAWFIMQLVTRAIYRLETTQLEVGTLAFAVLNFLTYAVWWDKPLNVECPHPVYWKSTNSKPEDCIDNLHDRDGPAPMAIFSALSPFKELMGDSGIPTSRKLRVPTFDGSIKLKPLDTMVIQLAALSMATVFGGIHCLAWFFAFVTHQEQLLWRICALAITGTPWLLFFAIFTFDSAHKMVLTFITFPILLVSIPLYIVARAIILVLMFTTLRHLPADAYQAVSWISLVPHL